MTCSFPGGASQVALMLKSSPDNAGDIRDMSSIPESGRPPEGGDGSPLQYSFLESALEGGSWKATVHRVPKSGTQLKQLSAQHSSRILEKKAFTTFSNSHVSHCRRMGYKPISNKS